MDNSKIGFFIKTLRIKKGLTQVQLAEKLHVTNRAVSKWEHGLSEPKTYTIILNSDVEIYNANAQRALTLADIIHQYFSLLSCIPKLVFFQQLLDFIPKKTMHEHFHSSMVSFFYLKLYYTAEYPLIPIK